MRFKKEKLSIIFWVGYLLISFNGISQTHTDTVKLFQHFNAICSQYQKLPLQLSFEVTNNSNMILAEKDSLSIKGLFDFQNSGGYIRIGNQEELIDDTSLLVADYQAKRFILSLQNSFSVTEQFKQLNRSLLNDSSAQILSSEFRIDCSVREENNASIVMYSKDCLPLSKLSVKEYFLEYNPQSVEPKVLTIIKRRLYPINHTIYDSLFRITYLRQYLIKSEIEDALYVIKEDKNTTRFNHIGHKHQPVFKTSKDYLIKENNSYTAKQPYKDYNITILNQSF